MLNEFLTYLSHELNRAPLTISAYSVDIEQFQKWVNYKDEEVDFTSVTSSDVRAWLAVLSKDGNTPRTIRRKIISLRTFFKWMIKTEKIKKSPMNDVVLPKLSKPLPEIITPEEIEESINTLYLKENEEETKTLMNSLILEMLYTLGIRRAELVGINDEDISREKAEIRIRGKRSKQRVVPLPQQLLKKITDWQNLRNSIIDDEGHSPLFVHKGKRLNADGVYRIVRMALSATNARKKSPHALRHSFASGMLNGGAEIDSVREFLGHASLATTQIYTHISLKEIKKAYSQAHPRSHSQND